MRALLLILLLFITGCIGGGIISHEDITIKTEDNVEIKADYFEADSDKSLILLHQLSMTKHSWKDFALKSQSKGYNVIAIDLRGHGLSEGNWKEFKDNDFNKMLYDIKAAHSYLKEKHPNTKVAVIGSSIGSNLAIKYLPEVSTSIALSPGLNYKGLDITNAVIDKKLLIITGKDDKYSYSFSQVLAENDNVELKVFETNGHGNELLNEDVESLIFDWLKRNL